MSQYLLNRIKEDEDFWKDVLEKPKKKTVHKANTGGVLNELNTSRQAKFDSFLNKYQPKYFNKTYQQTKRAKIKENVEKMLLKEKRKAEARKKHQDEQKQNKENEEIQKCTFKPIINQYPNKTGEKSVSPQKIKNSYFYEKSVKWFKNLKGKQAQKKQQREYSEIEYTFRPQINDSPLATVFNKTQLEAILPQNIYFLNTKENNRKKRLSASTNILPNANKINNDTRNKQIFTSRCRSLQCSIDVLRNELRNTHNDQYEDGEDE